jgi:NNP family nitrate/nitrite transporter-like MFS transporter
MIQQTKQYGGAHMEGQQKLTVSGSRFAGIPVPPDLKKSHFFNLYLASFFIACLMGMPAILQPAFLKEIINIPRDQAGSINSGLQIMSQIATLLFVGAIGVLSDKIGRRILVIWGCVVCGVFYLVFGFTKDISLALGISSVGGQVAVAYIIRFFIGIGLMLSFYQTGTLCADYTTPRDRGKAMALHGAMIGLSSIFVFGVIAQVAGKMGLMSMFYMAGALGLLGLISSLGIADHLPKEKAPKLGLKAIYREVSRSRTLKVGYIVTLVTRVDIIVITTYLMVWMVYAAEKFGLSPVKATAKGGLVMMVMALVTLVAYPILGILLDRVGRVPIIIAGAFAAGIAFCLIAATGNPFAPVMFIYVPLMSVGFSAASLGAMALTADASPKPLLGSILGGLNTMQPIGILIFLLLGGYLFDKIGYWTPFALKGIIDIACGLWVLSVKKGIVEPKEEEHP